MAYSLESSFLLTRYTCPNAPSPSLFSTSKSLNDECSFNISFFEFLLCLYNYYRICFLITVILSYIILCAIVSWATAVGGTVVGFVLDYNYPAVVLAAGLANLTISSHLTLPAAFVRGLDWASWYAVWDGCVVPLTPHCAGCVRRNSCYHDIYSHILIKINNATEGMAAVLPGKASHTGERYPFQACEPTLP
jgi:hypothetical protein